MSERVWVLVLIVVIGNTNYLVGRYLGINAGRQEMKPVIEEKQKHIERLDQQVKTQEEFIRLLRDRK